MSDVYVVGDGVVFLSYYAYCDYCNKNGLTIMYPAPKPEFKP